ncbi:MAG: hypothetical protein AMXMBFR83_14680 [Phycisphaerae bacterium]
MSDDTKGRTVQPAVNRVLPVVVFLIAAQAGQGQIVYTPRAIAPSLTSRVNTFGLSGVGRSFNRLGLYSEHAGYSAGNRQGGDVSLSQPSSFGLRARRGSVGRADNRLYPATSLYGNSRGMPLIRPGNPVWSTPTLAGDKGLSALTRSYGVLLNGDWGEGIPKPSETKTVRATDVRTWGAPLAPRAEASATRPAEEGPETPASPPGGNAPQVSLGSLVAEQLASQRRLYLQEGWVAFREGRYQVAGARFNLAERASIGGPRELAEAKIACLFARFAAHQYAEAAHALKWLLESYPGLAPNGEVSVTDLIPLLPSRYGRPTDLDEQMGRTGIGGQIERLENMRSAAAANPQSGADLQRITQTLLEARVLRAFVMYGIPDQRGQATFEARALANAPPPWNNLSRLLTGPGSEAASAGPTAGPAGQPGSSEFPFNLFRNRPPLEGATRPGP